MTAENVRALIHPEDWERLQSGLELLMKDRKPTQNEFRVKRPNGEIRWCIGTAAPSIDGTGRVTRISGVTVDITDRKIAEERQALLAREVDHRAKNALALVQSIVRLTRASDIAAYTAAVEGRIRALSRAHTILSLSRWQGADIARPGRGGAGALPDRETAKVALGPQRVAASPRRRNRWHSRFTNSSPTPPNTARCPSISGRVELGWELNPGMLVLSWTEIGGPPTQRRRRPASAPGSSPPASKASSPASRVRLAAGGAAMRLSVPRGEDMIPVKAAATGRRMPEAQALTIGLPWQPDHGGRGRGAGRDGVARIAGELGFLGARPVQRISEAMIALRNNHRCGGSRRQSRRRTDLPAADVLAADHVPFVFITGYGADEIEPRYADVPILQKPIEPDALKSVLVSRHALASIPDRIKRSLAS